MKKPKTDEKPELWPTESPEERAELDSFAAMLRHAHSPPELAADELRELKALVRRDLGANAESGSDLLSASRGAAAEPPQARPSRKGRLLTLTPRRIAAAATAAALLAASLLLLVWTQAMPGPREDLFSASASALALSRAPRGTWSGRRDPFKHSHGPADRLRQSIAHRLTAGLRTGLEQRLRHRLYSSSGDPSSADKTKQAISTLAVKGMDR